MKEIAEEFYQQRDRRTSQYLGTSFPFNEVITVGISEEASNSPAGQHLLLSLTNMLARVHRIIIFNIQKRIPLAAKSIQTGMKYLDEAVINLARLIDPYGNFDIGAINYRSKIYIDN